MQEFKTKFKTDISQSTLAVDLFRQQSEEAVKRVRDAFQKLSPVKAGTLGFGNVLPEVIRLGAEIQQTKLEFEALTGSAELGNALLRQLREFSNLTPFDTDSIIQAGRMLLNAGVETGELNRKLEMLGNIAVGSGTDLSEIAGIYSNAAAQGQMRMEDLNRLTRNHIPILQSLASSLGISATEVAKFGEQGKISFEVFDETLAAMSSNGGHYFKMMASQTEHLSGQWLMLSKDISNIATEIGVEALPELSAAVTKVVDTIEQMRQSGELQLFTEEASEALGELAGVLGEIVTYLIENKDTLLNLGMTVAVVGTIGAIRKALNSMINVVGSMASVVDAATLQQAAAATQAAATQAAQAKLVEVTTRKSAAARVMIEKQAYAETTAAAVAAAKAQAAAAARHGGNRRDRRGAAFKARQNVDAAVAANQAAQASAVAAADAYQQLQREADAAFNAIPQEPPRGIAAMAAGVRQAGKSVAKFGKGMGGVIRHPFAAGQMAAQNFGMAASAAFIGWELGKRIGEMLGLEDVFTRLILKARGMSDAEIDAAKNAGTIKPSVEKVDLAAAKKRQKEIGAELAKLREDAANIGKSGRADSAEIAAPVKEKIKALEAESAALSQGVEHYRKTAEADIAKREEVNKKLADAKKHLKSLEDKRDAQQKENQPAASLPTGFIPPGIPVNVPSSATPVDGQLLKDIEAAKKRKVELEAQFAGINKTRSDYIANTNALAAAEKDEALETAEQVSAAEKFKAERAAEQVKKRLELERQLAAERKKLDKAKKALADEEFRDNMTSQIAKWRENIKGYQDEIDKTEKRLSKLGLSVDEDILKTPEQLEEQKLDEILKAKIEAHNQGKTVTFTEEESARIGELKKQQDAARKAKTDKADAEKQISEGEKSIQANESAKKSAEQADKAAAIAAKEKALGAADLQFKAVKEANAGVEKLLTSVAEILKKGLPDESF